MLWGWGGRAAEGRAGERDRLARGRRVNQETVRSEANQTALLPRRSSPQLIAILPLQEAGAGWLEPSPGVEAGVDICRGGHV